MAVNVEHKRIPHFVCVCVKEIDSRRLRTDQNVCKKRREVKNGTKLTRKYNNNNNKMEQRERSQVKR